MKDLIISVKRQKKELSIFIICLILAEIVNGISIVIYKTNWTELFTHIGYVFVIAIGFYFTILGIRGLVSILEWLFKKKR